jgi:hypothetical protein
MFLFQGDSPCACAAKVTTGEQVRWAQFRKHGVCHTFVMALSEEIRSPAIGPRAAFSRVSSGTILL